MINSPWLKRNDGFLLVEILIAGLIISVSIAATMHLFQVGFNHLGRVNISNQFASRLSQSINLLKTIDPEEDEGTEDVGEGVTMVWKSKLLESARPLIDTGEITIPSNHEVSLYKINFQLKYNDTERDYELNILRSKTITPPVDTLF